MKNLTLVKNQNVELVTLGTPAQVIYEAGLKGAKNTEVAYTKDVSQYLEYCNMFGAPANEASTVMNYLTYMSNPVEVAIKFRTSEAYKYSSLMRKLASVRKMFELTNQTDPTETKQFRTFCKGLGRVIGKAQKQTKALQNTAQLEKLLRTKGLYKPATAKGKRDKAIILFGLSGAFRKSEMIGLDLGNLDFQDDCLVVSYYGSKTNQSKELEQKAIFFASNPNLCPIRALLDYIKIDNRKEGALFSEVRKGNKLGTNRISGQAIWVIAKEILGSDFCAHSLRASFITIARKNGSANFEIKAQTKHKTDIMIDRYYASENLKDNNASSNLGL